LGRVVEEFGGVGPGPLSRVPVKVPNPAIEEEQPRFLGPSGGGGDSHTVEESIEGKLDVIVGNERAGPSLDSIHSSLNGQGNSNSGLPEANWGKNILECHSKGNVVNRAMVDANPFSIVRPALLKAQPAP
jgi:hypothetical protein